MKSFIKTDATVYYLRIECEDVPVRAATVTGVYPEDDSVDLLDPHLGDVTVDAEDVFETMDEARAEFTARTGETADEDGVAVD